LLGMLRAAMGGGMAPRTAPTWEHSARVCEGRADEGGRRGAMHRHPRPSDAARASTQASPHEPCRAPTNPAPHAARAAVRAPPALCCLKPRRRRGRCKEGAAAMAAMAAMAAVARGVWVAGLRKGGGEREGEGKGGLG